MQVVFFSIRGFLYISKAGNHCSNLICAVIQDKRRLRPKELKGDQDSNQYLLTASSPFYIILSPQSEWTNCSSKVRAHKSNYYVSSHFQISLYFFKEYFMKINTSWLLFLPQGHPRDQTFKQFFKDCIRIA